jgi:2-polyprenyl-6-methoxyphenol hydroxylase-like FAD-dependent oxidoreductase
VLEILLPLLPSNVQTEFSTRVSDVENVEATATRSAHVRLTIEPSQKHNNPDWPGTTRSFEADVVIGCDGVKSVVRNCIGARGLGSIAGQTQRFTGTYAYRGLLDVTDARKVNGDSVVTPTMWLARNKVSTKFACAVTLADILRSICSPSQLNAATS